MIVNQGSLTTLWTAYNAAFHEGFGQAPTDHEMIARVIASSTAIEEYGWLGEVDDLREWVGERVIGDLTSYGYTIRNRKFERTIAVKRDEIEDDQHGQYGARFRSLGDAAARHPCRLVFDALLNGFTRDCYDGQYFFDDDHPAQGQPNQSNVTAGGMAAWFLLDLSRYMRPIILQRRSEYELQRMDRMDDEGVFMRDEYRYGVRGRCNVGYGLWQLAHGSKAQLNAENYERAAVAMMELRNDVGAEMGVTPTHLVVPPSLKHEGLQLLKATHDSQGASNVWMGDVELIVSPWARTRA